MPARRRRGGWRTHKGRIEAYVRIHAGPGGLKTTRYPLGTAPAKLQEWIDKTFYDYRKKHPKGAAGTLASDVPVYLTLLVDRPGLKRDRELHLAWWCERFGQRARHTLESHELEAALRTLTAEGYAASTVKKYRTALFHLFTKLDGKTYPNPLRDVPPPREPDPLPRAIPYEIIDELLRYAPLTRDLKIDTDRAATIYAEATRPQANRSAIARAYGLSETMVRKIVARGGRRHGRASQTRARLQLMAYVGLPPALIRAIEPGDYNPVEPSLLVRGRKKGGGTRPERLPLTPRGVQAIEAFIAADAFEQVRADGTRSAFAMSSALRAWRSAIRRMCDALEAKPETCVVGAELRRELAHRTPYDLRHSFLTEAQLAFGNIHATQRMGMHADARTTRRYTLAAVAPELKGVAAALALRRAGQVPVQPTPNEQDPTPTETGRKTPIRHAVADRPKSAKREPKVRKIS